jgi:hypothetical protein
MTAQISTGSLSLATASIMDCRLLPRPDIRMTMGSGEATAFTGVYRLV